MGFFIDTPEEKEKKKFAKEQKKRAKVMDKLIKEPLVAEESRTKNVLKIIAKKAKSTKIEVQKDLKDRQLRKTKRKQQKKTRKNNR